MWFTHLFTHLCMILMVFTAYAYHVPLGLVPHVLDDLQHVECISVICPAGSQLSFCKRNKTSDYCHQCPTGSSQPLYVDSRTVRRKQEIPKCTRVDIGCPPEAVSIRENGRAIDCKCDTSRGYVGHDYMLCLKYPKCPPGRAFDTQNGACSPCPVGTFNPVWSYESCTSHTNCTLGNRETVMYGNTTVDTVCGEVEPSVVSFHVITTNTILQDTPYYIVLHTIQSKEIQDTVLKHPPDRLLVETEIHKNSVLTFVTLVMSVVILVLASLLAVVFCRLRKEKPTNAKITMELCDHRVQNSGNEKPGIQAEDDCGPEMTLVASDNEDDGALDWAGNGQPGTLTIYPQINAVPCTPTAPSMTPSMNI